MVMELYRVSFKAGVDSKSRPPASPERPSASAEALLMPGGFAMAGRPVVSESFIAPVKYATVK